MLLYRNRPPSYCGGPLQASLAGYGRLKAACGRSDLKQLVEDWVVIVCSCSVIREKTACADHTAAAWSCLLYLTGAL